jgi:hypothetical protein
MKTTTKLWIGLAVLCLLSPLGLILPDKFKSGSAWGEWSTDEMQKMVGYVPSGMKRMEKLWKAPMPDYALKGQEKAPLSKLSASYIISAIVGVVCVVAVTMIIGRIVARRDKPKPS